MKTEKSVAHSASATLLDGLRFFLSLLVVATHARILLISDASQITHISTAQKLLYFLTNTGPLAVLVFFVLSGYLVGGGVLRDLRNNKWSWQKYAINRSSRIFTVLGPSLVIGCLLDFVGLWLLPETRAYSEPHFGTMLPESIRNNLSLPVFFGNLFSLQEIIVPTLGSNHPLWSLANEVWYYVAFPLIAVPLFRGRFIFIVLQIAACVGLLYCLPSQMALLFSVWLIGVLVASLPTREISTWLVALNVLILFIWFALVSAKVIPGYWYVTGAIAGLLIHTIRCVQHEFRERLSKYIARCADISFTLYLTHTPLLVIISALVVGKGGKLYPGIPEVSLLVGSMLLCVVWAYFLWFLFESRTDKVRQLFSDLSEKFGAMQDRNTGLR